MSSLNNNETCSRLIFREHIVSQTPPNLFYSPQHQWVAADGEGNVAIGITDFAQNALGDVVFVEFPALGTIVAKDEACAVVESVKSASDIFAPIAGTIMEINPELEAAPERVNQAPYGAWIFKLKIANAKEVDTLLDATAYQALTAEQAD